jgi:uncharacterized ion transporter superfamily protein YfcC
VVAALTWIIPAGQYERAMNETLGKEAPVPGGLAIGRVSYNRWLRFLWPLLMILAVIVAGALSLAAVRRQRPWDG